MHEIEVKAVVRDKARLLEGLAALGCTLGEVIRQDDTTYVKDVSSLENYLKNSDFLRLRVQDDGAVILTLKHHPTRATDLSSAPLEHELSVSSRDQMEKVLTTLGYQEAVRIRKERRKGRHGIWEVCVDEVEGIGPHVELEQLAEPGTDVPTVREEMRQFLAALGVEEGDFLKDRYDVLLLLQGRFKEVQ
jgi:predicted adenylyl cyclase CyaB